MRKALLCAALLAFCISAPALAADKLNLNTATAEELAKAPCIGPELAKKILEYRENVGDFASPDDLKDVEGIDPAKAKEIEQNFEIKGVASADCNC